MAEQKLLGDQVEKAIEMLGGKHIAAAIEKVTKKPCNCAKRKEALNRFHKRLINSATPVKIERIVKPGNPQPRVHPQPRVQPRIIPRAPRK